MSDFPRVSVVITCYNYAHFLAECVYSVLRQTEAPLEIIIVDDGSTDETPQVAAPFAEMAGITYLRRENGGQAVAKNTGIAAARGDLIAFLDADDVWQPTKLAKQVPLFADPLVGVVYSRARWVDENTNAVDRGDGGKYLRPRRGRVTDWLFHDNFVWFSSSVVRRSCFDEFGTFDETLKMGIDWDLWLRISTRYQFDFVDEPLLDYRVGHAQQMSKNLDLRYSSTDRVMDRFLATFPGEASKSAVRSAYYLTYCNRASYLSTIDRQKALDYVFRAMKLKPYSSDAYRQLIRLLIRKH